MVSKKSQRQRLFFFPNETRKFLRQTRKYVNYLPWKKKNVHDLLVVINNYTKFQLNQIKTAITLWPWNTIKVTESGMNGYSWMNATTMQSLTFIVFIVSEKIATLMFLHNTNSRRPAGLTLIITQTHTFHVSQKANCTVTICTGASSWGPCTLDRGNSMHLKPCKFFLLKPYT